MLTLDSVKKKGGERGEDRRPAALVPLSPRARSGAVDGDPSLSSRRAVSLQKGTNQPATRMSLNRSQRSCRSTKYGTQAKT
jgi:hypothetical protein